MERDAHVCRCVVLCGYPLQSATGYKLGASLCLMARGLITTFSTVLLMMVIDLQMSLSADSNQVCSVPKRVKNTKMNLFSESYEVNSHLRYLCEDGYKRQAGTSNLAICQFNDKTKKADWKYGNISCIRDPSIPTSINTKSPFTTSESSPSRVSTSSSTTVERFTIKIHETLHTTQAKATQTTQIPGHTPMMRFSTTYEHTPPEQTLSPGLQIITQTLFPKDTGKTLSEETTVSTTTTVMEKTGYTATVKHSTAVDFLTPVQSTSPPDPQMSIWQKTETIAVAGTVVVIIPLVGIIILVVYCRKRSAETSLGNYEDTQVYLQNTNPEDNLPTSDTSLEESEEETFL